MNSTSMSWPQKTHDLHNHHFDSTVWDDFRFRDEDVVVATYAKAGTTWTQQIVTQLLHNGAENVDLSTSCPWVDLRLPPKEEKLAMLEDPPAGGCAGLFAQGKVPLRWPRRP